MALQKGETDHQEIFGDEMNQGKEGHKYASCEVCGMIYKDRQNLYKHVIKTGHYQGDIKLHRLRLSNMNQCLECEKIFDNK